MFMGCKPDTEKPRLTSKKKTLALLCSSSTMEKAMDLCISIKYFLEAQMRGARKSNMQ